MPITFPIPTDLKTDWISTDAIIADDFNALYSRCNEEAEAANAIYEKIQNIKADVTEVKTNIHEVYRQNVENLIPSTCGDWNDLTAAGVFDRETNYGYNYGSSSFGFRASAYFA